MKVDIPLNLMLFYHPVRKGVRSASTNEASCLRTVADSQWPSNQIDQSAGAVEYTNCTSAEGHPLLPNEYPGYDTKQYDGEVPVMLELWGMQSTPLLPLLPGPLWPGMVVPDRAQSMG